MHDNTKQPHFAKWLTPNTQTEDWRLQRKFIPHKVALSVKDAVPNVISEVAAVESTKLITIYFNNNSNKYSNNIITSLHTSNFIHAGSGSLVTIAPRRLPTAVS